LKRIEARIREATKILKGLDYDCCSVSPQEFSDYMTGETPTGDPVTLYDVLGRESLMVHEVAETSELKKMKVPINKQTVIMHYPKIYEAHITALDYELAYFLKKGDIESIKRILSNQHFHENLEDPYLPQECHYLRKELEPRFTSMVAKYSSITQNSEISPTSAESKIIIQDYYSKRAHDYDRQKARTWNSSDGFSERIVNELVSVPLAKSSGIAIEAGIGSGRVSSLIADKTDLFILGVDFSKSMLDLAKSKTYSAYSRIALLLADFEHLPFKNQAADFLYCISALHYLNSLFPAIIEFSRVLKTGGVFVSGDLSVHELDADYFMDRLEKALSPAHGKYYKPSEIRKKLAENGFLVNHSSEVSYRKSFESLIEDKANYFGTLPQFRELIAGATEQQRKLYDIREKDLELHYLLLIATKEKSS
jgi:ubiquinone/menaquinone biosynthesis C-methylase UbiE